TLAAYPAGDLGTSSACDYACETGPRAYRAARLQVTVSTQQVAVTVPPLPQAVRLRVRLATRPAAVAAPDRLPELPDRAAFETAARGWRWEDGLLWVKLPPSTG